MPRGRHRRVTRWRGRAQVTATAGLLLAGTAGQAAQELPAADTSPGTGEIPAVRAPLLPVASWVRDPAPLRAPTAAAITILPERRPKAGRHRRAPEPAPAAGRHRREFAAVVPLSADRSRVVELARTRIGSPYIWGAEGPYSFDCSGLVQWVFARLGYALPRVSYDQARIGTVVPVSALRAGDLIAWPGHIAIWAGAGRLIEAQRPGTTVHERIWGEQGSWDAEAFGVRLDYSALPRL